MTKIWSQGRRPSSLDWKMIFVPSAAREASAFWPPKVSWRTLARNFSSPGARSEGDPDEGTAATAAGDRAGGEQAAATATAARNTTGRSFRPQAFVSRIPSPQPAARFAGDVGCGHGRGGSEGRGASWHSPPPTRPRVSRETWPAPTAGAEVKRGETPRTPSLPPGEGEERGPRESKPGFGSREPS